MVGGLLAESPLLAERSTSDPPGSVFDRQPVTNDITTSDARKRIIVNSSVRTLLNKLCGVRDECDWHYGFWQPRRPDYPFGPVALRPHLSVGLLLSDAPTYLETAAAQRIVNHDRNPFTKLREIL